MLGNVFCVFRRYLLPAPGKKHVQVRTDGVDSPVDDHELRMSVGAYQRAEPGFAHGRSHQTDMPRQNDRAVLRYQAALHDTCLFSGDDTASVMLGLRLEDQLEDDAQPSVYVDHSGDLEAKVKRARSHSLPASELVAVETETDDTYDLPPDLSPLSEESKTAECERSRYLSKLNTDPVRDSVSLLRAPGWTAVDSPTTGADIETVL